MHVYPNGDCLAKCILFLDLRGQHFKRMKIHCKPEFPVGWGLYQKTFHRRGIYTISNSINIHVITGHLIACGKSCGNFRQYYAEESDDYAEKTLDYAEISSVNKVVPLLISRI